MRVVKNPQMQIGEVDISKIVIDPKSRDDLPNVLRGLQYIYTNLETREAVFKILEENILPDINKQIGRPGMDLWDILVLGAIRLNLNYDYDRLQDQANHHSLIRQILGHSDFPEIYYYELQTIKDNVHLLTPEILDKINQVVVKAGHKLLKKKDDSPLNGRCDSFVVETNVHYPTDINLLLDALRKVIFLTGDLAEEKGLTEWRQREHNFRGIKKLMRCAQNKKRGNPKKDEQKKKKEEEIKKAHQNYINASKLILGKVIQTILKIEDPTDLMTTLKIEEIKHFINHANRQISQINRRVILGETIPHDEKVFSIFQPHTEWIVKGKAGVPQELGLKVGVFEDQYQFILHHQVIEKKTDDQIAVSITKETRERFKNLCQASYDKGFHSPSNQEELKKELEHVILPRKGKLSKKAREHENNPHFLKARCQHSAVESAINALEHHGLGTCPDHGIHGFKRYVALAVVAFNIGRIGAILKAHEQKIAARKRNKYSKRVPILKIAA